MRSTEMAIREDTRELPTTPKRGGWYLLFGLILGLILGLVYTWVINPVIYETTAPSTLSEADKDTYRLMIARVYASTENYERAILRLEILEDSDPVFALGTQAQHLQAAGNPDDAHALALLASAIQEQESVEVSPQ